MVAYLSRKRGSKERLANAASLVVAVEANLRAWLEEFALRVWLRVVAYATKVLIAIIMLVVFVELSVGLIF